MDVLLEICIDSIDSAWAAQRGGASRLEVCNGLALGGTTPSWGLVERCVTRVRLPVMMMIRPHDGGFVYSTGDLETMLADIEIARSLGVRGVVMGALTEHRAVDRSLCQALIEAAGDLETTFHRAFDLTADPDAALDDIVELGFTRLLTSGQATTAEKGAPLIGQLRERAGDHLIVMAGSGANATNAKDIVEATGVVEIHASASEPTHGQAGKAVTFGSNRRVASADLVRSLRHALDAL